MTVLNFPDTSGKPTDGSFIYVANGVTYTWDGDKWTSAAEGSNPPDVRTGNLQEVTDLGNTTTNGATFAGSIKTTNATGGDVSAYPEGQLWLTTDDAVTSPAIAVKAEGANQHFGVYKEGTTYIGPDIALNQGGIPTDATIELNVDGSASFASGALEFDSTGMIGTNIKSAGNIELDSTGTFTDPKITLNANRGNATFAGSITAANGRIRLGPTAALISDPVADRGILLAYDGLFPCDASGTPTNGIYDLGAAASPFKDGYFAGNVTANGNGNFGQNGGTLSNDQEGVGISAAGDVISYVSSTSDGNANAFAVYRTTAAGGGVAWSVKKSGASAFAGTVTAENYNLTLDDGTTMDVKRVGTALKALKAAAAAATDFADLKAAIATALAEI